MKLMNRDKVLEVVVRMLAAESSCIPADLLSDSVTISTLQPDRYQSPHHRRFPIQEPNLLITTTGTGGVVAVSSEWLHWVKPLFAGLRRDETFSQAVISRVSPQIGDAHLYGPIPHFVGSLETVRTFELPSGYEIRIFNAGEQPQLLDTSDWPHAVFDRPDPQRPEKAAALAYHQETVIGVATAVADSDTMWQIGIDVSPDHRGKGLGAALTATVAKMTLETGCVPYYATSPANIPSIRTALSAGLWPCWVQVSCAWH